MLRPEECGRDTECQDTNPLEEVIGQESRLACPRALSQRAGHLMGLDFRWEQSQGRDLAGSYLGLGSLP